MSPEACEGRDLTTATDVYSLGVVLYEMLVGFPPFNGDSPVDIALQHVGAPPLPPSKLRPELPPAAEAAVMRALSKQPADRQPTALQLAAEFEAAIGGADQSQTGEGGMKQANLAYVLVGLLLLLALVLGAWATFGSDG
jgi:serine/threonine-protein kinase